MPVERFVGRVGLLTGATQGIGLATAKRLAQEGCKVVISSRKQENVDEAVEMLRKDGYEVSGLVANQRLKEDRKKLIDYTLEKYGSIDCAFISAGASPVAYSLSEITEGMFDRAFDTNVKSNFMFIQELVPLMEKNGGGTIVTNATASVYGAMQYCTPHLTLYQLSKTALMSMVQNVSKDCYNRKVRVNCVAPGAVDTAFLAGGTKDSQFESFFHIIGVKRGDLSARLGQPEEIASVAAFLLSDDSSFVSGNCIIPAGGFNSLRSL